MDVNSLLSLAQQAWDEEDHRTAEIMLHKVLERDELNPIALGMLGTIYSRLGVFGLGLALLRQATELDISIAPFWSNLGATYRSLERLPEARAALAKSVKLDPSNYRALSNLSATYINNRTPREAEEWARKALKLCPDFPEALNHLGISLLEQDRYDEAWDAYEGRMGVAGWHRRSFGGVPNWDGKTKGVIAIAGEQGIGDEIMFMSCLRDVIAVVGSDNVLVECKDVLNRIVRQSFGVHTFPDEESMMSFADLSGIRPEFKTSLGSLPRFFRRSPEAFPKHSGYLRINNPDDLGEAQDYLRSLGKPPYIGLAWRGGTPRTHAHLRNSSLKAWRQLMETNVGTFVSVQYGSSSVADVQGEAQQIELPHDQARSLDYYRLHALTQSCDLVITVCQTAWHTRGGTGQPVWCITPYRPAWRYHLNGSESLWYPSGRLFRQSDEGLGWRPVFKDVRNALLSHSFRREQ